MVSIQSSKRELLSLGLLFLGVFSRGRELRGVVRPVAAAVDVPERLDAVNLSWDLFNGAFRWASELARRLGEKAASSAEGRVRSPMGWSVFPMGRLPRRCSSRSVLRSPKSGLLSLRGSPARKRAIRRERSPSRSQLSDDSSVFLARRLAASSGIAARLT